MLEEQEQLWNQSVQRPADLFRVQLRGVVFAQDAHHRQRSFDGILILTVEHLQQGMQQMNPLIDLGVLADGSDDVSRRSANVGTGIPDAGHDLDLDEFLDLIRQNGELGIHRVLERQSCHRADVIWLRFGSGKEKCQIVAEIRNLLKQLQLLQK